MLYNFYSTKLRRMVYVKYSLFGTRMFATNFMYGTKFVFGTNRQLCLIYWHFEQQILKPAVLRSHKKYIYHMVVSIWTFWSCILRLIFWLIIDIFKTTDKMTDKKNEDFFKEKLYRSWSFAVVVKPCDIGYVLVPRFKYGRSGFLNEMHIHVRFIYSDVYLFEFRHRIERVTW